MNHTDSTAPQPAGGAPDTAFFGHPRGLATLFFTEVWERFSYYGMRALLILFMTAPVAAGGLGFDAARAGAIYGLYTAAVYLGALPGGWVADRLIGQRRAVLYGGIIIAAGQFLLAAGQLTLFYGGLVVIVLGTALLKPNVSSMVGELYPEGGARRDAGFSIFYMGINLGAFISPLVCGYLGQNIDWRLGFGAAGVGMLLGLAQYIHGDRYLGAVGKHSAAAQSEFSRAREWARARRRILWGVLFVALLAGMHVSGLLVLTPEKVASASSVIIVSLVLIYFLAMMFSGDLNAIEKKRIAVVGILFLFSSLFWSGFEQAGSSLNLFANRLTDLRVLGWDMPASWLQSVNGLFIILLAPVFAWLWVALKHREPSSPAKFSLGLLAVAAGFLLMMVAAGIATEENRVSPLWLLATYFLHTVGELCLSPVGLSTVTKLAPQRVVGQMMGIWFTSISLGNLIAGQVAGRFETFPLPQLFGTIALVTAVAGLILALLIRPIRNLMSGVH